MITTTQLELAEFGIFIVSVMLHEISHGWVALSLGDDTAKRAGRLTLNPLAHIDPFGSILLPLILVLLHGPVFGWAKPVPVNVARLRNPRNDAVLTSLAGPAMNAVLVAIAWVAYKGFRPVGGWPLEVLFLMGLINLWLGLFNMLPIPPLDGSALIERLLPQRMYGSYLAFRQYALLLVFAFIFFGDQYFVSAFNWVQNEWGAHLLGIPFFN